MTDLILWWLCHAISWYCVALIAAIAHGNNKGMTIKHALGVSILSLALQKVVMPPSGKGCLPMTVPPTAVGTFRDKKGRYWVNIEVICDFLGIDFSQERRKLKSHSYYHPHEFARFHEKFRGLRTRTRIFSLPADECQRWISSLTETQAYKCEKSGKRMLMDRAKLDFLKKTFRRQKALRRHHSEVEAEAIPA